MLETYQNQQKNKIIAIVVTLVVVVGLVVFIDQLNGNGGDTAAATSTNAEASAKTPEPATTTPAPATDTPTTTGTSATAGTYKDGTYSAAAEYYVPHGYEDIKVTLTVAGGTVTGSEIVNSEGDRESVRFQDDFAAAYKQFVVGKKLDGLSVSAVSGASDTTDGFNDAVAKIRQQAQS
jgi:uncharacterized protein with FMN-binding domain